MLSDCLLPLVEKVSESYTQATDQQLQCAAHHWAVAVGELADTMRHLIDEEQEYRLAVAHEAEAGVGR